VTGVLFGVVSAIGLIIISPIEWGGAGRPPGTRHRRVHLVRPQQSRPDLDPARFVGCIVGTLLSTERETERSFHELYVRSETGLGAERPLAGK